MPIYDDYYRLINGLKPIPVLCERSSEQEITNVLTENIDMLTTKELIAIITAYDEGKTVQVAMRGTDEWEDVAEGWTTWDTNTYDFRIKPAPAVLPYKTATEVLKAMKDHGPMVKDHNTYRIVKKITTMENGDLRITLSGMKEWAYELIERRDLVWQDGTVFGRVEL